MENLNERIERTNEQIRQLQNKKKKLLSRQSEERRKQRTHRLIERGAILESVIGNATDFSNEQIQALLIEIFSSEFARSAVEKLREQTEQRKSLVLTRAHLYASSEQASHLPQNL